MDLTVNRGHISQWESSQKVATEHPIDCNITLPDYLPPIVRILKCNAISGIQTGGVTGDRVTTECDSLIRILYICSEGKLHSFQKTIHFTEQLEFKGIENLTDVLLSAKTDYVNYRVSGKRAFEVHGAVTICGEMECKKDWEYLESAEGNGVASKIKKINATNLCHLSESMFTFSDETHLQNAPAPIGTIIESKGSCSVTETKVIKGKLFVKGELSLCIAYLSSDDEKISQVEISLPLNRIVEADGITENSTPFVILNLLSLDIRPKYDSSKEKSYIDVSATIGISAKAYECKEFLLISDAYSTKYEALVERGNIFTENIFEKLSENMLCKDTVNLKSTGISEVLSFICNEISGTFTYSESEIIISGFVTIHIIYKDLKGEISYAERQIPFEFKKPLKEYKESLFCKPHFYVSGQSYVIPQDDAIDVRIEICIDGFIFDRNEHSIVKNIEIDKEKKKDCFTAPLTIYFGEKNEKLWSIAQKYNTTVEAIAKENNLKEDFLTKDCKLLIPKI